MSGTVSGGQVVNGEGFYANAPSLIRGSEKLSAERELRVPALPPSTISVQLLDEEEFDGFSLEWQGGCAVPGARGPYIRGVVREERDVNARNAKSIGKLKRELIVDIINTDTDTLSDADAGDAMYFLFENSEDEYQFILSRLGLIKYADRCVELTALKKGDEGTPTEIPTYIPQRCSARYLLKCCLDIRRSPSRSALRALAEFTENETEKRRLTELASVQGSAEYTEYIRKAGISIADFLAAFPSCKPTLARLIEILPRLLPRAYSLACHHSMWNKRLRFVYSLLETKRDEAKGIQHTRYGACSQWLKCLRVGDPVTMLLKEPSKFRLPPPARNSMSIVEIPLIMLGPGTGVAPFISFLQKLKSERDKGQHNCSTRHVRRILFYGSSNLAEEFLFRNELEALQAEGVVELILCESRVPNGGKPIYVQDAMAQMGKELLSLVLDEGALIYACGEPKTFSRELWQRLGAMIRDHLGHPNAESMEMLKKWRDTEVLIEDAWG